MGLPSLPSDVLVYMMTLLDPYDIAQVSRLSKRFNALTDADQIWKSLYARDLEYSKAGTKSLTGDQEVHPGREEDQKLLWKTRYRLSSKLVCTRRYQDHRVDLFVREGHSFSINATNCSEGHCPQFGYVPLWQRMHNKDRLLNLRFIRINILLLYS